MTIGGRIKKWRAEKNLKQDDASSLLGLKFSSYQKYEMDISKPGSDALEAFAKAGINIHWLLTGEGEMLLNQPPSLSVFNQHPPIASASVQSPASDSQLNDTQTNASMQDFALIHFYDVEASAGHGSRVDQEHIISQMAFRKDWLKQRNLQPDQCALIKAKGDSMEPTIHDGDLLLVDTSIDSIKDDAIYIVQADHHLIVKRLQQSLDGSLTIISDNQRYEKQTIGPQQAKTVKIAGRVKWYGHEI